MTKLTKEFWKKQFIGWFLDNGVIYYLVGLAVGIFIGWLRWGK